MLIAHFPINLNDYGEEVGIEGLQAGAAPGTAVKYLLPPSLTFRVQNIWGLVA